MENPSNESLVNRQYATFKEFIRFLVDPDNWPTRTDIHWNLYYNESRPCEIKFDFIGEFDQMGVETVYILKHLLDVDMSLIQNITWSPSKTHTRLLQYYSQVGKENIRKIWEIYKMDFELFGYRFPGPLQPLFSVVGQGNSLSKFDDKQIS